MAQGAGIGGLASRFATPTHTYIMGAALAGPALVKLHIIQDPHRVSLLVYFARVHVHFRCTLHS